MKTNIYVSAYLDEKTADLLGKAMEKTRPKSISAFLREIIRNECARIVGEITLTEEKH